MHLEREQITWQRAKVHKFDVSLVLAQSLNWEMEIWNIPGVAFWMYIKGLACFCTLYGSLGRHEFEPSLSVQTMQFLLSRTNDGIKCCPGKKKNSFRCYAQTSALNPVSLREEPSQTSKTSHASMRQSTASLQSCTNNSLSTEVTSPPPPSWTSDKQQRGSFSGSIKHFWVGSIALTPQQRREVHRISTFSGENLFPDSRNAG